MGTVCSRNKEEASVARISVRRMWGPVSKWRLYKTRSSWALFLYLDRNRKLLEVIEERSQRTILTTCSRQLRRVEVSVTQT